MRYSNQQNISLAVAVMLATDNYDKQDNVISATTLLKPIRQVILSARVPQEQQVVDVSSLINSSLGTALHDAMESAWRNNYQKGLKALGYPDAFIATVKINPLTAEEGIHPVYVEQRMNKEVAGKTVSGKFDIVIDGEVQDLKSTKVFTLKKGNKDEDYILQGSIYRWLNPDIIKRDTVAINFWLTDWQANQARQDPSYPQSGCPTKRFQLLSIPETDRFVRNKLAQLEKYWNEPEDQIPLCTDKDLWRSEPEFKYYKNPEKMSRSTKNFDTMKEARMRYIEDGSVGIIVEKPGQVTACKYCSAFAICKQKDALIASGDLIL